MIIFVSAGLAQADDRIAVLADTFRYEFGRELHFHLEATSPAQITQVILAYGPAGKPPEVTIQPAGFKPGPRVSLDHAHDLTSHHFQPFSQIEYHWTVVDSRGQRLTTSPIRFSYEDNRFAWQRLEADGVTVTWYQRPIEFGRTALYVTQHAQSRIVADTGGDPQQALRLYIYASIADLAGAAKISGQEWVVGQAYPKSGVCLVVIPEDHSFAREMERVIPHEISHLLVGTMAVGLPRWLDEGLATDNEGLHDPQAGSAMETAVSQGALLRFEQLCDGFPVDPRQAALAYAQSGNLVAFIRQKYGQAGLRNLTMAYKDTPDCQSGMQRALGISLPQLQAQWEASLPQLGNGGNLLKAGSAWLVLWLGSCVITLLALESAPLLFWRRRRQKLDDVLKLYPAVPLSELADWQNREEVSEDE